MRCLRSYPTPTSGINYPRQVAFAENEKVIVGGSKEGDVYVFDTKSGAPLDVLHHSDGKVLAVAVSQTN
jgi:WD40 repeat protein